MAFDGGRFGGGGIFETDDTGGIGRVGSRGGAFVGGFGGGDDLGLADGRFDFGWVIDLDKALFEPKTDFFETILGLIGHFEEVNFGLMVMIEIVRNDVLEFGISAGADVTDGVATIFVHDEEDVSAIEIFPEAFVSADETFGVGAVVFGEKFCSVEARNGAVFDLVIIDGVGIVFENRGGPVNDFIATTFEIASPVDGAFVEFGATANNEFFHNL